MKSFFFTFLLSQTLWAANSFNYTIQFGDKSTEYKISETNKNSLVKRVTGEFERKISINEDNQNFLFEQIEEIAKLKSNDPAFCPNRYMKIEYVIKGKKDSKLGCINSPNSTAQKLTGLANLLGFL